MNRNFFEDIHDFSTYWKRHGFCLSHDCIEKGIRLLSTSSASFRTKYSPFFLTKLVNAFCFFEQKLKGLSSIQRSLFFRLFKIYPSHATNDLIVQYPVSQVNSTLGIAVGVKVSGPNEFLSQERLLQALLRIIPGVATVPQREYLYKDEELGILFLYKEIEKKRGRGFSKTDLMHLRTYLSHELEESIECYSPSLCLVRNEEEIFRSIVQMGREIHQTDDLPQVTISFQEQTNKGTLRFSVVIVRLINATTPSLKDLKKHLPHTIHFTHEMTSEIGNFDKEYTKQANIILFEVEGGLFGRKNSSIDLREARLYVVKALNLMIGEFRDYNGGLFSKQHKQLRAILEMVSTPDKFFLESLFYAFKPSHFQTFILPEAGKVCASLFLEAKKSSISPSQSHALLQHHEPSFSVVVIKTPLEHLKEAILKEFLDFSFPLHQFGCSDQWIQGEYYLVLVYQYPKNTLWIDQIHNLLTHTQTSPNQEKKILRINYLDGDPLSLNPQIGVDLRCRSLQKALFEGLTRISPSGIPELAAAEKLSISSNGKNYLFQLKHLQWSNGEDVTAVHFEKTWKKAILSHSCLRPDFFYILQNGRKAHFKTIQSDDIGVKALDSHTLQVTLEYPAPYFLEMLAHPLFFPSYEDSGEPYVFCGPFMLHSWQRHQKIILMKNPYYWDFEHVDLDEIEISIIRNPFQAYEKYQAGDLDWIGGPFSLLPTEIAWDLKEEMHRVENVGVSWLYYNLAHPLFSSSKMRKALSLALDREQLCKKALLDSTPLKTQLPKSISLLDSHEIYNAPDPQMAIELFKEGLRESGCSYSQIADLKLLHSHIPGQKELATEVQRQWQETFGIKISHVEEPWNTFSHQLDNRLIHLGCCYRHPFYLHPMYFFQIFYEPTNIHNAFGWQNETFKTWIDQARLDPHHISYLKQAELTLLEEMPVLPTHEVSYQYLVRSEIKGIYFCPSGDVDFKWVYIQSTFKENGS